MAQTLFGLNRNSTAKWWSRLTFGLSLRVCLRLLAFHCEKIQQHHCIQAAFNPLRAGLRPLSREGLQSWDCVFTIANADR